MIALELYQDWCGVKITPASGTATVTTDPRIVGSGTQYTLRSGDYVVLTGFYFYDSSDYVVAQTTDGLYINLDTNNMNQIGSSSTKSAAQATDLLNTIISANQRIYENNLLLARFKHHLSAEQQQQVVALQLRVEERNDSLIESGLITNMAGGRPEGYSAYEAALRNMVTTSSQLGLVITSTTLLIAGVIAAAVATAAYYAFLYYAEQAVEDVKFSDKLTKILAERLSEEEYAQLEEETKGIVTKAVLADRLQNTSKAFLWLGLVALGFFLPKLLTKLKK